MRAMTWTTAIAAYAAMVSTGALVVAVLAWRSGGPHLKARAVLVRADNGNGWLAVYAANEGRADITIASITLWVGGSNFRLSNRPPKIVDYEPEKGPPLPHRMLAHSMERWLIPADVLDDVLGRPQIRWQDYARVNLETPFGTVQRRVRQPLKAGRRMEQIDDRVESYFQRAESFFARVEKRIESRFHRR
jgi:hypothetical protein